MPRLNGTYKDDASGTAGLLTTWSSKATLLHHHFFQDGGLGLIDA